MRGPYTSRVGLIFQMPLLQDEDKTEGCTYKLQADLGAGCVQTLILEMHKVALYAVHSVGARGELGLQGRAFLRLPHSQKLFGEPRHCQGFPINALLIIPLWYDLFCVAFMIDQVEAERLNNSTHTRQAAYDEVMA